MGKEEASGMNSSFRSTKTKCVSLSVKPNPSHEEIDFYVSPLPALKQLLESASLWGYGSKRNHSCWEHLWLNQTSVCVFWDCLSTLFDPFPSFLHPPSSRHQDPLLSFACCLGLNFLGLWWWIPNINQRAWSGQLATPALGTIHPPTNAD